MQFNILPHKRHNLLEEFPEHKVGVTYPWSLMKNKTLKHSLCPCKWFSIKKHFISQCILHALSSITPKTPQFFSCYLIIHYPTINSHQHTMGAQTVDFTPTTGCSLWGTNWMSYRLASLQNIVTRTFSIVIAPWYQTRNNNTNKTHCYCFRIVSFLEILS